jgi:hypothetical protein
MRRRCQGTELVISWLFLFEVEADGLKMLSAFDQQRERHPPHVVVVVVEVGSPSCIPTIRKAILMEWARVIPRCNFACPKHFEASSNRSGI